MEGDKEFVNVAIRIKPIPKLENPEKCLQVISKEALLLVDRSQTFVFDNIFTEQISQESIYNESVKQFVDYVKQGFNCTVFAYGQTGTGKTYTMGTNPNVKNEDDFGLIPRALNHFFNYDDNKYTEVEISLSFIEIYNEKVFDLLQNDNPQLQFKGLKVQGLSEEKVFNAYDAKHFLKIGNRNRHTAGTKQNIQSSRSHAVFTIYCKVIHEDRISTAKLNLVDLAGCESVRKTGTYGSTFQEGVNINKGLLCLGQVMTALCENASHIPYRGSVLTSILRDSLNKQNFVSLIACISSLAEDSTESLQTLEFAQRVKKLKNKPEVNDVILQYKMHNPTLFQMRSNTPFKRPLPMKTPKPAKKAKPLEIISEPCLLSTTDQSHSSKSFSSSVASSVCSSIGCSDMTQQALSPIVKKYMTAIEASLQDKMEKLEFVIKSTIKRPSRRSILENECNKERTAFFGTPCLPWDKIQNEVSKIVRSEISQLTSTQSVRATSSPITEPLKHIKKTLYYDESSKIDESIFNDEKENEFKVPSIIPKNKKSNRKSTICLSPIENIIVAPRRSVRLSMNRMSHNISNSLKNFELNIEPSYLASEGIKRLERTINTNRNDSEEFFECGNRRISVSFKDNRNLETSTLSMNNTKRPKKKLTILDTPAGKRLAEKHRKDSPCTSHTKNVLKVLNTGATKEIQQLHLIGPKTAQQIDLFRKIKGKFNKISDLEEMPGWGSKRFEKFVQHNLLKKQLI